MFKADWEKTSVTHHLPQGLAECMLRLAFPNKKLISYKLITGGCANLNYVILLEGNEHPLILRIYLRDKNAAYREQKITKILKPTIPIPLTYFIGEVDEYHFAITEFMPGIPLRNLLLSDTPFDISSIMQEVGVILSKITLHRFSQAGFFDNDLSIHPHAPQDDYLVFVNESLKHKTVLAVLSQETISHIRQSLDKYNHLFPAQAESHLVHGDFDAANLLVNQVNGSWAVSAVLDWEFAFSGSPLWDVANMLRYAHKMPNSFQEEFLIGLTSQGIILPENWRIRIKLLNLLSLLDVLKRSDPANRPKQCTDIRELIDNILKELDHMSNTKPIEVISYDACWPKIFESEAAAIKNALGDNCIAIHHIGSTSVPGLAAKPIIDMVPVVRDIMLVDAANPKMESLGYEVKGEFGIIFRRFFKKENVNVHVFEQSSDEIDRYIKFRDWMRTHELDREAYASLKQSLAEKFPNDMLNYCFGKDAFVAAIDKKTGASGLRLVKVLTPREKEAVTQFRQLCISSTHKTLLSYDLTSELPEHQHLILYQGAEIIAYVHIQLLPMERAIIRFLVVAEVKRNNRFGRKLIDLCERWLKSQGYNYAYAKTNPVTIEFYKKNRYDVTSFIDPYEHENDETTCVVVGKVL